MKKSLIGILLLGIVAAGVAFSSYGGFKTSEVVGENTIVVVEKGDTLDDVGRKLGIGGVFFKTYLKHNLDESFELQEGTFKIEAGADLEKMLVNLETPIYDEVTLKILEGWNIYDIDMCLSNPLGMLDASEIMCLYEDIDGEKEILQKGLINEGEFIQYAQNKEKIVALTEFFPFIEGLDTLEGFLYPDTYKIDRANFGINKMVIKQLETFEIKVVGKTEKQYDANTWEEIVNLASIVEKEEKISENKPIVAGILKKRLNEGWMIGADITVCYPHKLTSEECKLVVSKYIGEKSEYNTRTKAGLPKTPIGNPSYNTIESTINSKSTPYYFYLHDSSGNIYYGKTNAEHEYNKRKYMK